MKKLTVIALAAAACMLFAIPAMAVDVDFSGHYRVRGFFEDNTDLNDNTGSSNAAMDMRFRIEPVVKISDNLKVTTRFDGQDNRVWGDDTTLQDARGTTTVGTEDFGLERVYMDATFDMIGLRVGRMVAGACGLQFCDSETDADRIKVILRNIEPFYLDFTYQKAIEEDYTSGQSASASSDADYDAYWIHGFKSDETMTYGLLFGFYNNANVSATADSKFWMFDPYFKGVFGPMSVLAEAMWKTGDYRDTDSAATDRDYDAWRYIADVAYDFGPGSAGIGYAHADGQEYSAAGNSDYTNAGLGGTDWEPFLILTSRSANSGLGGYSNLNSGNDTTGTMSEFGFDIFYAYGTYAVMEDLTLNAIIGWATADEVKTPTMQAALTAAQFNNIDDDMGWEFDIGAKYKLMENLTYDVKVGFYQAGDIWKLGGANATVDDTWSVMHSLVVTF